MWYKKAQDVPDEDPYGAYHATNPEYLESIRINGLPKGSFFAGLEEDTSPYADGLWLRFRREDTGYEGVTARGEYYKTTVKIPPQNIEFKIRIWDDYQPLI